MSRLHQVLLYAMLAAVLVLPACADNVTLTQLIGGKLVPLSMQLKDLQAGWVRMTVSGQPGVSELAHVFSSMMGGHAAGVFYSKGDMLALEGEKYLVAYGVPMRPVDSAAMRGGNPPPMEPLTADTALSLSLLKMQTLGSLLDIRPFDLASEISADNAEGQAVGAVADTREKARITSSLNNLRQIAVAAQMFCQDHKEILPDAKLWLQELNLPKQVLTVPGTADKYLYNDSLGGKTLAEIKDPATTIFFYEPNPRADGSRLAAFIDGHVAQLQEAAWQEAKQKSGMK